MFIGVHDTLIGHRKVKRLARRLGISKPAVRGHLVTLWLSALMHATDGDLSDWDDCDIAEYAEWEGDVSLWVSALNSEGWIDRVEDHYVLHDWREIQSGIKTVAVAAYERERKRAQRQNTPTGGNETHVSGTKTIAVPEMSNREEKRGEDKIREDTIGEASRQLADSIEYEEAERLAIATWGFANTKTMIALKQSCPITRHEWGYIDQESRGKSLAYALRVLRTHREADSSHLQSKPKVPEKRYATQQQCHHKVKALGLDTSVNDDNDILAVDPYLEKTAKLLETRHSLYGDKAEPMTLQELMEALNGV